MKKLIISIAMVAVAAFSANAQIYVGGSLGFSTNKQTENEGWSTAYKATYFTFSPEVGYIINEKQAAGLYATINPYKHTYTAVDNHYYNTFEWAVSPFYRYQFLSFDKFGVWGQVTAKIGGGTKKEEGIGGNDYKDLDYGVSVMPVLTYAINEHFILKCNLNILSLGWDNTIRKATQSDNKVVAKYSSFNFGISSTSSISVGVFYAF